MPDVVFRDHLDGKFDAVVALYHDQGLIPVKLIDFDDAVNVTLGLPIVRTSPDHGVAHDIAGTGRARTASFFASLRLAREMRHPVGDGPHGMMSRPLCGVSARRARYMDKIIVKGAREHNLKNIDVELPRDKLIVITGLSGSGKSSLAFDTIYAEGQRRYVESLSAYARQFLEQMGKPDIDSIEGLSPAISIEQKSTSKNPRSTVGTVTEVYDYLRLLYARVGLVHCWNCGERIASQTVQQMVDRILELPEGTRFSILAPIVRDRKGEYKKELDQLRKQGFVRINIDGELHDLSDPIKLDKNKKHTIEVYVDRLAVKADIRQRLTDSVELALKLAEGIVKVSPVVFDDKGVDAGDMLFSDKFACITCGISYPEITPRLFSFNNPHGACPNCDGIGAKMFFDPDLIVPNEELSLREGAIDPWEKRNAPFFQQILEAVCNHYKIDMFTPWAKLPAEQKKSSWRGRARSRSTSFSRRAARAINSKKNLKACWRISKDACTNTSGAVEKRATAAAKTASKRPMKSSTGT